MKKENIKVILSYTMVIVWFIVIFCFSNADSNTSNAKSMGAIDKVVTTVDKGAVNIGIKDKPLSNDKKEIIVNNLNLPLRKIMHFSEYLILCILLINALSLSKVKHKYIISIIICIIYAFTDEYHQTFITGRTGQILDVIIDSTGALMGSIIYKIVSEIINKKKKLTLKYNYHIY